jgi:hypothetical protein
MKRRRVLAILSGVIGFVSVFKASDGCRADGLTLELPRRAYWRGENIPVAVNAAEAAQGGVIEAFLDGVGIAPGAFEGDSAKLAVPTSSVKVGGTS